MSLTLLTFTRSLMAVRVALVGLVLLAVRATPEAQGVTVSVVAAVSAAYILATLGVSVVGSRRSHEIRRWGVALSLLDSAFVAWASYGWSGFDSPLRHLLLVQLVGVALLASMRQALQIAAFQGVFVLGVLGVRAAGSGELGDIVAGRSGEPVSLGRVAVEVAVYAFAAGGTALVAVVNDRRNSRRRADLDLLVDLTAKLEAEQDPERVGFELLRGLRVLAPFRRALILRTTGEGTLECLCAAGVDPPQGGVPLGEGSIMARAVSDRRCATVLPATAGFEELRELMPAASRLVVVPLGGGLRGVGVMVFEPEEPYGGRLRRRLPFLLEHYSAHAAVVIRNAELLAEVRTLAVTDALTGLPNRRQLDEQLARACAKAASGDGGVGVLMIDVDEFKRLNDVHGHQVGDAVLQSVGHVLQRELRAGDVAARFGGEEFIVLLSGTHGEGLEHAAERLRAAIAKYSGPVGVTVSVGVASAPEHGIDPGGLIFEADAAMYRAKAAGRNRVVVADTDRTVRAEPAGWLTQAPRHLL